MAFKKKESTELNSKSLSKEFFGSGSSAAPGQKEAEDGTTNLLHAMIGDKGNDQQDSNSLFNESKSPADLGPDYTKKSWMQLGATPNPALNPYAAEQDKRYSMDPKTVKIIRLIVLTVVAYLVCAVVLPSSSYNINFAYTPSAFITCIQDNITSLLGSFSGNASYMPYKLCTYGILLFAGAGLAITGAVYQGALKNALVSPTTLGINSGATLGVALFVLFASTDILNPLAGTETIMAIDAQTVIDYYNSLSLPDYLLVTQGRAFCSIIGSFVAVGLVMLVSFLVGRGRSSSFALIICGQVVAAVATSVVEVIRYYVVETDATGVKSSLIQSSQIGAVNAYSTPLDLLLVAVPVTVGVVLVILLRRRLNLLAFNDEEARSMGIATEALRWTMVFLCTFITAVVVAFCGNVAFIGFAIPLIVRRYIGPDFNHLIPASAIMGALYLVVIYWITDLNIFAIFGLNLPSSVSMFTSTIGIVLFAASTIAQRRENRSADWL